MITKFNFYKDYADVIGDMTNKDAGRFTRFLLDFMFKDIEPKVTEKSMTGSVFMLMLNDLREEKESIINGKETVDRYDKKFTFYKDYSNIFYTLTEEKAGVLIKRICEFMFNAHYIEGEDYAGTYGVYSVLKRQLQKSKIKSKNATKRRINQENSTTQTERE